MCKIKFLGMKELIRKECERVTLKCLENDDTDLAQDITVILDSLDQEKREREWSKMEQAYHEFLEMNDMYTGMLEVNYIPISQEDFKDLLEEVEIKELSRKGRGFYIRDSLNREFHVEAC